MRITCPNCGQRDLREFTYMGHAVALNRPAADADLAQWDDYLHNRDNPAGPTDELWYHGAGCTAWLKVRRDTVTHVISDAWLVMPPRKGVK